MVSHVIAKAEKILAPIEVGIDEPVVRLLPAAGRLVEILEIARGDRERSVDVPDDGDRDRPALSRVFQRGGRRPEAGAPLARRFQLRLGPGSSPPSRLHARPSPRISPTRLL